MMMSFRTSHNTMRCTCMMLLLFMFVCLTLPCTLTASEVRILPCLPSPEWANFSVTPNSTRFEIRDCTEPQNISFRLLRNATYIPVLQYTFVNCTIGVLEVSVVADDAPPSAVHLIVVNSTWRPAVGALALSIVRNVTSGTNRTSPPIAGAHDQQHKRAAELLLAPLR